jgi:uncharacterized protein YggE
MFPRVLSFLVVLTTCVLAVSATAQEPSASLPTIVTTGEAIVRRAPDQAFVTVLVETRARAPKDAQRLNAEAMTAVQQRLTEAGIARDAVRTTGYSIQQEFDYSNGRRTPREFLARNGIEVRLDAVERTGDILDVAVQGGATTIGGLRFEIRDRAGAEREALRRAVEDARARADAMAAGAGRTIDRVLKIEDSRQYVGPPQPVMMRMAAGAAADAASTPVESGMVEVRAQVALTVVLK